MAPGNPDKLKRVFIRTGDHSFDRAMSPLPQQTFTTQASNDASVAASSNNNAESLAKFPATVKAQDSTAASVGASLKIMQRPTGVVVRPEVTSLRVVGSTPTQWTGQYILVSAVLMFPPPALLEH